MLISETGSDSEIAPLPVARKNGSGLATETGLIEQTFQLYIIPGEEEVVNGTKENYPELYVFGLLFRRFGGSAYGTDLGENVSCPVKR